MSANASRQDAGLVTLRQAAALWRVLARSGVDEVVSSPGARSTPLLLGALRSGLTVRSVVDERSAAFYGLGVGRAGGTAALLCTSGTAVAHYLPAVLEARHDGVPLVVVSADRPLDRQASGAPQTVDQIGILGAAPLVCCDLGELGPGLDDRSLRWVLRRAGEIVSRARAEAGPVHLDVRLRRPLQPAALPTADDAAGEEEPAVAAPAFVAARPGPGAGGVERLREMLRSSRRPLVVAGPAAPTASGLGPTLARLAESAALPLAVDYASQLRLDRGALPRDAAPGPWRDALLAGLDCRRLVASLRPDLVLQLGRPPVATSWEAAIEEWARRGACHVVVAPRRHDPVSTAALWLQAEVEAVLSELARPQASVLGSEVRDSAWSRRLTLLDREIRRCIEASVADGWHDGAAVRATLEAAEQAVVWLGNSLPIRMANLYAPFAPVATDGGRGPVALVCQRGVNGIDGNVSSWAGVASRSQGGALAAQGAVALLGDVALRHDIGGLELVSRVAERERLAMVLVVLHNGGGRIFEQLPLARAGLDDSTWSHWSTPSPPSFAPVAEQYGLRFVAAEDAAATARGVREGLARPGVATLLQVRLPDDGAARAANGLRAAIERVAEQSAGEGVEGGGEGP